MVVEKLFPLRDEGLDGAVFRRKSRACDLTVREPGSYTQPPVRLREGGCSRMTWTRRDVLTTSALAAAAFAGWPRHAGAQGRPITVAHSVSTFVYGQHLVAREKKFFEEEGVRVANFIVPGGGARVVNAVTAGQAMFGLGDSNHPLKATEKGKETTMLFATDTRCSYANIVVRKELHDRGVKSVEALADPKLVGRKAVIAATAIGSGTYVYGVYVLKHSKAAGGRPVNDHVEWVGGGASTTMLGGLKAGKFDAVMAVPQRQWGPPAQRLPPTPHHTLP